MASFQDKLIFIGDSLTQRGYDVDQRGWLSQLSNFYIRQLEVINRGFSGYNTKWVQPLVDDIISSDISPNADQIQLVTIWFGSNDGAEPKSEQHVPIEDYKKNLIAIINKLRKVPRASKLPILLVTPPPTCSIAWEKYFTEEMKGSNQKRESENLKNYAQVVRDLGSEYSIPVLDFWSKEGIIPEAEDQFIDGLHFSSKGNDIVFKLLLSALQKEFSHLNLNIDNWKYPHFTTLFGK